MLWRVEKQPWVGRWLILDKTEYRAFPRKEVSTEPKQFQRFQRFQVGRRGVAPDRNFAGIRHFSLSDHMTTKPYLDFGQEFFRAFPISPSKVGDVVTLLRGKKRGCSRFSIFSIFYFYFYFYFFKISLTLTNTDLIYTSIDRRSDHFDRIELLVFSRSLLTNR